MSSYQLNKLFWQARKDPSLVVLEGFHALKHAIRFNGEIITAVTSDKAKLLKLAKQLAPDLSAQIDDLVQSIPDEVYHKLAPQPPRSGVISIAKKPDYQLASVLKSKKTLVLLDNPKDLSNIGAVIRVSTAADAGAVLTLGQADPWNPAAIRGSAGLHFALPVIRVKPEEILQSDWSLIGLDERGEELQTSSLPKRTILVFGSERSGISPDLRQKLNDVRRIPMRTGVSSLNLATAVAITLYNFRNR